MLQGIAARLFRASPRLSAKAANAGQIAEFVEWQERVFGHQLPYFGHQVKLWERLAERLDPNRPLFAMEFGVAHGFATNWWLRRLAGRDLVWHGFDRFTGMPRAWREHGPGAFDVGGKPPAIDDPRVRWHVGNAEDTLGAVDLVAAPDTQRFVIFDMDIYEPTAFAWKLISPHLQSGDVIYLDEAGIEDERRILDELILPSIGCEPVGTSPLGLGLVVTRPVS
jgi:hypothetical protein